MPPLVAPLERLQPCVFERLVDENPEAKQESRNARVLPLSRYRDAVLRDLGWLLNASRHLDDEGLEEFPEVERSVFNFGKRGLAGLVISNVLPTDIEREVADAIRLFEPRIISETLSVHAVRGKDRSMSVSPNVVALEITGELWAQPFPEKLFIKTALDMESGTFAL